MIKAIQQFYKNKLSSPSDVTSQKNTGSALKLATAALLIEVSRADGEVKQEERDSVATAVQEAFALTEKETDELVRMADEEVEESVCSYEFTRLIKKGYSYEQKVYIIELLWQVVFADLEKDKHEEHLVRRIADLLHVSHKDFIRAKLKVKNGLEQDA